MKLGSDGATKAPSNVFTIILQIARTEGFAALYEGLGGEVLKGFFSHGITMIVKDAAHRLVIWLYYAILKFLRRYPSPQELAEAAKQQAEVLVDDLEKKAQKITWTAKGHVETAVVAGQSVVSDAKDKLGKDHG